MNVSLILDLDPGSFVLPVFWQLSVLVACFGGHGLAIVLV